MAAILITDEKNLKSFYEGVFTSPETLERKFVQDFRKATITYRIVDIGTSVRFKVEGSKDGSTYTDLFDSTETGNGSFSSGELDVSSFTHIRGKIEAITGGTPSIVVHTVIERFINPNVQIGGDDFSSDIEEALNNASAPSASNPFATQAEVPPPPLGDMTKVVYDPTTVNGDAFDQDNMVDGTTNKNFSATEQTKLTGIETGATADQTGAEIKVAYEGEADTNAYTDSEKTTVSNQSGTNTGDEPTADETTQGIVERATDAEAATGTDTTRYITSKQLADNTLKTKSGAEAGGGFAGNPKKKTVTFSTAFADTNYSVSVIGDGISRSWEIESKAAGSFVINSNSNSAFTEDALWMAIAHGES